MSTVLGMVFNMTNTKTFARQLGKRLAQVRKQQGLTQLEIAATLDLSQAVIAEYETGRKNIPVWRLVNLAEALGVEPNVFLCRSSKEIKRGPTPKLKKQMDQISILPKEQQRSILQVLDMALQTR